MDEVGGPAMSNFRESSQHNWSSNDTTEHINAGSLQRIADATEVMSKSWHDLLRERDMYLRWYEEEKEKSERYKRSNRALRGVITRTKGRA